MKPVARRSVQYHPRLALALAARGHILVVSLLLMGVILLLGTAASFLSLTNVTIANNVETNLTTRYRAEAGLDTAIAYIQTQAEGFLDNAQIDSMLAEANGLSFLGNPSSCPYDSSTGIPCVTVNRWTPETIVITATAGDPRTNAEYVTEASIRLTPNSSSAPPISLLADGIINLDGPVDLTGGTAQPYDDMSAHGNYGFSITPQVSLAVIDDRVGITASANYGICRGGGVASCPPEIIATQSTGIPNSSDVKSHILGTEVTAISQPSTSDRLVAIDSDEYNLALSNGTYVSAGEINSVETNDGLNDLLTTESNEFVVVPSSEDIVFPENSNLNNSRFILQGGNVRIGENSSLENAHMIVENGSIFFEGNNINFVDSTAIASNGIVATGSVTFLGTSLLVAEDELSGVLIDNVNTVSREDLTIISNGDIQINSDINLFRAGLQAKGNIFLNGYINLQGFAQSEGDINISGGTIASAEIISLTATEPRYTYGFVLSRN